MNKYLLEQIADFNRDYWHLPADRSRFLFYVALAVLTLGALAGVSCLMPGVREVVRW